MNFMKLRSGRVKVPSPFRTPPRNPNLNPHDLRCTPEDRNHPERGESETPLRRVKTSLFMARKRINFNQSERMMDTRILRRGRAGVKATPPTQQSERVPISTER